MHSIRTLLIRTSAVLCVVVVHAISASAAPVVTKVEPPSWWAGHSINPVRVLVRGQNLTAASVTSTSRAIVPGNVRVNNRGTYLFVDLNISRIARPADYSLTVENSTGK